jgi:rsbT co-antagonist protein RsbR
MDTRIPEVLEKHEQQLLDEWMQEQNHAISRRSDLLSDAQLRKESQEFIGLLKSAILSGNSMNTSEEGWQSVREFLNRLSFSRAEKGFNPTETALFVFSFKQPLFSILRKELGTNGMLLADETWRTNVLLDQLGLYTTEVYQKSRNEIIRRQQREILELSTPVVRLWSGILALPLIGTLDSERTQVVMENLLKTLVETGSSIAIIDITGVPTVDTLVAQHLLKTVAAARLMGADCFISGIRPQIAQTIVHLGVSLPDVATKANLADAFALALQRMGLKICSEVQ